MDLLLGQPPLATAVPQPASQVAVVVVVLLLLYRPDVVATPAVHLLLLLLQPPLLQVAALPCLLAPHPPRHCRLLLQQEPPKALSGLALAWPGPPRAVDEPAWPLCPLPLVKAAGVARQLPLQLHPLPQTPGSLLLLLPAPPATQHCSLICLGRGLCHCHCCWHGPQPPAAA